MQYPKWSTLSFLALCSFTVLLGCGSSEKLTIKGVDVSTAQIAGQSYVNLEAIVVMGNLKFPNVEVPVINPTTLKSLGQMALQNLSDGTNRLYLSLNFQDTTGMDPNLGQTLPNGREIPSSLGVKNTALVGIPILEQSRVYVGGGLDKDLFIGAAIAIPAFDSVLNPVQAALNIFFSFPFSTEVNALGGLFTSSEKSKNGVAIFVHKSPASPPQVQLRTLASIQGHSSVSTAAVSGSDNEMHKLNNVTLFRLNRLLQKRATVKVK